MVQRHYRRKRQCRGLLLNRTCRRSRQHRRRDQRGEQLRGDTGRDHPPGPGSHLADGVCPWNSIQQHNHPRYISYSRRLEGDDRGKEHRQCFLRPDHPELFGEWETSATSRRTETGTGRELDDGGLTPPRNRSRDQIVSCRGQRRPGGGGDELRQQHL